MKAVYALLASLAATGAALFLASCANPIDTGSIQNDWTNCGAVPSEPGWYLADEPCGFLAGPPIQQRATEGLVTTLDLASFDRDMCAYRTLNWVDPYFGTFSSGPGVAQGLYLKGFTGDPPGPEAYMRLDAPNGDVCLVTVAFEPATSPSPWAPQ